MRSAHELGQLPFEGRVAKARPRRAPERMLLEKAFWSTRYVCRVGYFRYGPADRRHPSTVWMRSAYRTGANAESKVVKICDVTEAKIRAFCTFDATERREFGAANCHRVF